MQRNQCRLPSRKLHPICHVSTRADAAEELRNLFGRNNKMCTGSSEVLDRGLKFVVAALGIDVMENRGQFLVDW